MGQSFFDPLPAGADLYVAKSVIGDWPDREAATILHRLRDAARPSGRIVIVSGVSFDTDRPAPALLMLVLVGGRDRTLQEFGALANQANLEVVATGRQTGGRTLVECRPLV